MCCGNALHACQRFESALRLFCLGGLGTEARDEGLHVRDDAGLLFVSGLLRGELRGTGIFECRVIAGVQRQFRCLDVGNVGNTAVEKIAIM